MAAKTKLQPPLNQSSSKNQQIENPKIHTAKTGLVLLNQSRFSPLNILQTLDFQDVQKQVLTNIKQEIPLFRPKLYVIIC